MMLFLQRYSFTVVYRKGSSLYSADTLSRALCHYRAAAPSVPDAFQLFRLHLAHLDPSSPTLTDPIREQLRRATATCQDMLQLKQYILQGWPPTRQQIPPELQAFWHFRDELSLSEGLLVKSTRTIVPTFLRLSMLSKLH